MSEAVLLLLGGRRGAPCHVKGLEITEAPAGSLALDIDLLPSSEVVRGEPVAVEFAAGLGNGRKELDFRHDFGGRHVVEGWWGG